MILLRRSNGTETNHDCGGAEAQRQSTDLVREARQDRANQLASSIGHVIEADIHCDPFCIGEAEDQKRV